MRPDQKHYVYMMSNKHRNVLYVGVTNNLKRRLYEHENGLDKGVGLQPNSDIKLRKLKCRLLDVTKKCSIMKTKTTIESKVREIKRATKRKFSAEEKIRIVLEVFRADDSLAAICRRESIHPKLVLQLEQRVHGGR